MEDIWAELGLHATGGLEHVFASEKDQKTRAILEHNFQPVHVYKDVTKRALHQGASAGSEYPAASEFRGMLDLYVAGFPCQAWSRAGLGLGMADPAGSGLLWIIPC